MVITFSLLHEKSEAIALALLGLIYGMLADWLAGRQSTTKFRNF